MTLINLTSQDVTIRTQDGAEFTLTPQPLKAHPVLFGVPVVMPPEYYLPEPQPDVFYLVEHSMSKLVERSDLLVPRGMIREGVRLIATQFKSHAHSRRPCIGVVVSNNTFTP